MCCDRKLTSVFSSSSGAQCCQGKAYHPNISSCCNGKLSRIPEFSSSTSCCGLKAFYRKIQVCCDGNLFNGTDHDGWECCNGKPFDPLRQLCCQGIIKTKRSSEDHCCGTNVFNFNIESCCRGTVYAGIKNGECCQFWDDQGKFKVIVYDPKRQVSDWISVLCAV